VYFRVIDGQVRGGGEGHTYMLGGKAAEKGEFSRWRALIVVQEPSLSFSPLPLLFLNPSLPFFMHHNRNQVSNKEMVRFMNTKCEYEVNEVGVLTPFQVRLNGIINETSVLTLVLFNCMHAFSFFLPFFIAKLFHPYPPFIFSLFLLCFFFLCTL
jgi:hypothetical protein